MIGVLTLIVARTRALLELDAKKIVALSTLSQLGLIFISLSIGIPSICFFHILIHALAKANLFIVVGSLLHRRFSQQDSRLISSRTIGPFLIIRIRTRLVSLIGIVFISGFYSKEQVLTGHSFIINRLRSNLLILVVVGITISYCLKLFLRVLSINPERVIISSRSRITQYSPILLIRRITIIIGYVFRMNSFLCTLILQRIEGIY